MGSCRGCDRHGCGTGDNRHGELIRLTRDGYFVAEVRSREELARHTAPLAVSHLPGIPLAHNVTMTSTMTTYSRKRAVAVHKAGHAVTALPARMLFCDACLCMAECG